MSMVHPMARTTPRTRAEIHESRASLTEVTQTYNISRGTARKWRNRSDHLDRSHRAHQLATTLSPAQELIVMEIRRLCLLPLDDLVSVTREFINAEASRSGISRLLRREGLSKLADLQPKEQGEDAPKKTFKDYEPGYLHIDIKYLPKMPDESSRRCSWSGHRPRHPLGVSAHLRRSDRAQQCGLSAPCTQSHTVQNHQAVDRQRNPVHRAEFA